MLEALCGQNAPIRRLWNGHGEQMITVFFPNPWLDETAARLREPRWERTALWEDLRARYADAPAAPAAR